MTKWTPAEIPLRKKISDEKYINIKLRFSAGFPNETSFSWQYIFNCIWPLELTFTHLDTWKHPDYAHQQTKILVTKLHIYFILKFVKLLGHHSLLNFSHRTLVLLKNWKSFAAGEFTSLLCSFRNSKCAFLLYASCF